MTERRREWLYLIIGLVIGTAWFVYNRSIDFGPYSPNSDAVTYSQVSSLFKSFGEAFTYAGARTFGFPFLLYLIKRVVEFFASPSPEVLFGFQTATLLAFHFVASILFYRAIRNVSLFHGLRLHPSALTLILLHPGLVAHTSVLLTDTFTSDLIMLASVFLLGARLAATRALVLRGTITGLILGFAVATRPFLAVSLISVFALAIVLLFLIRKPRQLLIFFSPLLCAFSLILLPSVLNCRTNYGRVCMQSPVFSKQAVSDSMQMGMTFFRYYGSTRSDLPVMPEDWSMVENWGTACEISKITGPSEWLRCVSRKPLFFPVFLAKKVVGLFDSFFLQPYAQDVTSAWARHYSRIFGTISFIGFFCAIGILFAFLKRGMVWESLVISLPVLTLLFQLPMHIEPRYSFSVVPVCLFAVAWLFQWSLNQNRRVQGYYLLMAILLGGFFLFQTHSWDLDDLILQQREAWDRSGAGSETRVAKIAELLRAESDFGSSASAENHISLGLALASMGRHAEAIEHYERAEAMSSVVTVATGHLCMENAILRKWDEAIRNCARALSSVPPYPLAKNTLQYAKRAKEVEGSVVGNSSRQINLGLEYYASGDWVRAIETWRQISNSSPYFATSRSNMGSVYIMMKDFRSARTVIDEALRLEPDNELFRNNSQWLEKELAGAQ